MTEGPNVARVANLLGDQARATMMLALMGGRALTASELASIANITKQTASTHLAKLVDASLLVVKKQGRHRYHQLADNDIADLIERLMGVADRTGAQTLVTGPRDPELRKARVCYDHLAGDLAVQCMNHVLQQKWIRSNDTNDNTIELTLTTAGLQAFDERGIHINETPKTRRPTCRACLDWSERRHHLAGTLGALLLQHCIKQRWARRIKGSRVVLFSSTGEQKFSQVFCGGSRR